MLADAIQKLTDEMKSGNNSYVQAIGTFLMQHLVKSPQDAEKILNPDKSIMKSLDEMRKVAVKKKIGNCAVLMDQEGFDVVVKYFGIISKEGPEKQVTSEPKAVNDFDIKLEDLL